MAKKQKITEDTIKRKKKFFEAKKNWLFMHQKSKSLYWSARILRLGIESSALLEPVETELRKFFYSHEYVKNNCSSSVRLLFAYAIETMLKTLNILKHDNFKQTHNFLDLASTLKPIKFSKEENKIFRLLEHEVMWASRYPNPKKFEDALDHFEQSRELLQKHKSSLSDKKLDALWNKLNDWVETNEFMGVALSRNL